MLEVIPKDKVEITLFVMALGGEFERKIPEYVKVIPIYGTENSVMEKVMANIKIGEYKNAIKVGYYYSKALKSKSAYESEKYLSKTITSNDEIFDIAIAYHVPASFPVIYVTNFINSKAKIAWIHSDVEHYQEELKKYINNYYHFDKIFCVSKDAMLKFNRQYPLLSEKTDIFYNIVNQEKIYKLADEFIAFENGFNEFKLLTVGRLTPEKGQDCIPSIINELKKEGISVKWYLIGDGNSREDIEVEIKKYNVEDNVILLRTKLNPYPYFKECDIYVQTSRHEGYCITLAEARAFYKPIITTNFLGAREQIIHNYNGLIVNRKVKQLVEAIKNLIINDELRNKFYNNLKNDSTERVDIEKLLNIGTIDSNKKLK